MEITRDEWKRMKDRYQVASSRINELMTLKEIDVYDYHLVFEALDDCYELLQAVKQTAEWQEEL